jgi:ABC-2 type transport system permease protein
VTAAAPAVRPPARRSAPPGGTTLAVTVRVLRQLRHDPRTIALLLVVPSLLLGLLDALWSEQPRTFDRVGLIMLAVFPFVVMFLVTSIAMLRERTSGTLERLLTTPLSRPALLLGYGTGFGLAAAVQAAVTAAVGFGLLGLQTAGPVGWVFLIAMVDAVLGVALGLLCSAFARSEFQAVQFMPVVVLPQVFLCGLLVPRGTMAGWLQAISDVLPMTYAVDALQEIGRHPMATGTMWVDVAVVAGAALLALGLAAATLPRRTS